jgi:hypothetical protein
MNAQIQITSDFHNWAKLFASKQLDHPRGHQVYLNTLGILAIEEFIQSLGIATNREGSRSWYPTPLQIAADLKFADIYQPEDPEHPDRAGYPGSINVVLIIPETPEPLPLNRPTSDCIAYIAISLNAELDTATILGYLPIAEAPAQHLDIPLEVSQAAFKPIAGLTDYLGKIRDCYRLLDNEDNQTVRDILELISEQSLPQFAAHSYAISSRDDRERSKRIAMQDQILSDVAVSDIRKDVRDNNGPSESEHLSRTHEARVIAKDWLDLLATV